MFEVKDWRKVKGATKVILMELRQISPLGIPEAYFSFLAFSNGGEGPLRVQPLWLQLAPAEEVIRIMQEGDYREFFPELFVIGSNGGGEAIAFDMRAQMSCPLVAFDMTNADLSESIRPIAANFESMVELIGE